ncbi:hypothetical protein LWI28_003045 [Acer negundo]|uniref:Uncharacterized protein n=1 Tax=Acer negundo TaxID=4023 RepID=A0AAD5IXI0_ACENE|nr:hypothetical protein LWI28_003045 [Acer negundo]
MLTILKDTRSKQVDAHAARKEKIKPVKKEILKEIAALEGRTRAVISEKKAHPIPPAYTRPTGGPAISEETAHIRITMERSLKELADREAAASDPSGKGRGQLPGIL